MRRFLLRLAWLAIFLCVPVQTAALAAEPAKPLTVRAVFEGELPLAGMRVNVSQTVPAAGRGALSRVSKRIRRGWKRRTAMGKHGPRLRACWKRWP